IPINVKEFSIDFMMSTSNKCIQGMAGVCFVICNKDELEKLKDYPKRSFYLDLYSQYDYFTRQRQTQFTPPVQTIYALRRAIDELLQEGTENRYLRYRNNWQTLRKGITGMGFRVLTAPADEANLLITILYPEDPNFDFNMMHDKLYEKGYTIYPGKVGKLDSFRLAVMGAIDHSDISSFLGELRKTLQEMGVKLEQLRSDDSPSAPSSQ
ncbi:MAG: aminotransferase class V-fold PLP-dependent enzyme, partial [Chloroflexi bacterium]|nr:aminotransferase class V-fold PLP-dependent enzyme [Chloroflexota bacterium]